MNWHQWVRNCPGSLSKPEGIRWDTGKWLIHQRKPALGGGGVMFGGQQSFPLGDPFQHLGYNKVITASEWQSQVDKEHLIHPDTKRVLKPKSCVKAPISLHIAVPRGLLWTLTPFGCPRPMPSPVSLPLITIEPIRRRAWAAQCSIIGTYEDSSSLA